MDVLVTLAVISVLIGLLLPTLSGVRETTRQVVCRSNVRQVGFGIVLFADDHKDQLPSSIYASTNQPHLTTLVRRENPYEVWDGLGFLYSQEYLPTPGVFYCPSHKGAHPLSAYADRWGRTATDSPVNQFDIMVNYQYRGNLAGPGLLHLRSPQTALVSDGIRTQDDFNHDAGTNLLRADLSANWFADPSGRLRGRLPANENDVLSADKVNDAWNQLDQPTEGGS